MLISKATFYVMGTLKKKLKIYQYILIGELLIYAHCFCMRKQSKHKISCFLIFA